MGDAKSGASHRRWLYHSGKEMTNALYQKLHAELTVLAVEQIRDLESARDIASDCLINLWEHCLLNQCDTSVNGLLKNELKHLCQCFRQQKKMHFLIEIAFYLQWATPASVNSAFRLEDRMEIKRYFTTLEYLEQTVISMILFEEMDITQIAKQLGKPITSVKVIRDRAIYQLKKRLNPKDLPISQLSCFISLFCGIAAVTQGISF